MILAHLSDLHVSRYGGHMASLRNGRRRLAKPGPAWETVVVDEHEWRVERRDRGRIRRKTAWRLVGPDGLVHRLIKAGDAVGHDIEGELTALAELRRASAHDRLAGQLPGAEELDQLLGQDPENTNLRMVAVGQQLARDSPDWVLVSGDLTDDGVGYDLVAACLQPWVQAGRLVVIPGNHDIYPTPPLWTAKALRKSLSEKRALWRQFTESLGQPTDGAFVRRLDDGVELVCLDSCHPPRTPASASGMVPLPDIEVLDLDQNAPLRLGCLHHHVVNLPIRGRGFAPPEAGMRLRNANHVLDALREIDTDAVLNGHRHVGYQYRPAGGPLFVSAPSTTTGCRSGASPFYWQFALRDGRIDSIVETPIEMLR